MAQDHQDIGRWFRITFEVVDDPVANRPRDWSDRVAGLLKHAKRSCGLKCQLVEEVEPPTKKRREQQ